MFHLLPCAMYVQQVAMRKGGICYTRLCLFYYFFFLDYLLFSLHLRVCGVHCEIGINSLRSPGSSVNKGIRDASVCFRSTCTSLCVHMCMRVIKARLMEGEHASWLSLTCM